jgi:hypothetical protein
VLLGGSGRRVKPRWPAGQRADKAGDRGLIGKDADDVGAPFGLAVEAFERVGIGYAVPGFWYRVCRSWLSVVPAVRWGAWSPGNRDRGAWSTEGGQAVPLHELRARVSIWPSLRRGPGRCTPPAQTAQYGLHLESMDITYTRALSRDTDFVSFALQLGSGPTPAAPHPRYPHGAKRRVHTVGRASTSLRGRRARVGNATTPPARSPTVGAPTAGALGAEVAARRGQYRAPAEPRPARRRPARGWRGRTARPPKIACRSG